MAARGLENQVTKISIDLEPDEWEALAIRAAQTRLHKKDIARMGLRIVLGLDKDELKDLSNILGKRLDFNPFQ